MNVSYKREYSGRGPAGRAPYKRVKISVVQYPEYWQEHGDIEIEVDTVRFKIQSYHLVKSSLWFRDWKARVSSKKAKDREEKDDEREEGEEDSVIAVARLNGMGLTATDFVELLNALNHAITFTCSELDFHRFSAVLRSSHILSATQVKACAIRHFKEMWPTAVEKVSKEPIPFAVESIFLARKFSVLSVLKRAFYELIRGPDDYLDSSSGPKLSVTDLAMILKARSWLMKEWQQLALRPTYLAGEFTCTCMTHAHCERISDRSVRRVHEGIIPYFDTYKGYSQDPICGLEQLCDLHWEDQGFCRDWIIERKLSWRKAKKDLWHQLDEMLPAA